MSLATVWFWLIAILFTGYFFLEGFDYGVGLLLPVVGRTDRERRMVIASIGPVWDANEVWLITAAGAMFAAFPGWYATLFSAFYLPLFAVLVALILRGVGLEFRSKVESVRWRTAWDALIAFGSAVPALGWGVGLADLLHGLPIDAHQNYVGTFADLFSPYALVGGAATLLVFALHGALYLTLKTEGELAERARRAALWVGAPATAAVFVFVFLSYLETDLLERLGVDPGMIPILAGIALVSVRYLLVRRLLGWAFAMTGLTIVLSTLTIFAALYPRLLVSTLGPAESLTIANAAAGPYSLRVMTIVAVTALPLVLAYQAWTYWVFRQRISTKERLHY